MARPSSAVGRALLGGVAVAAVATGCRTHPTSPRAAPPVAAAPAAASAPAARRSAPAARLRVPRTGAVLRLDGELDEPAWQRAARTRAFPDLELRPNGRPFSEVKALWDEQHLYLALYAADEDIRTAGAGDVFSVRLTSAAGDRYAFAFSPAGTVVETHARADGTADPRWRSRLKLGVDLDGTANDPRDYDEEWIVETAIPLAALGVRPRAGVTLGLQLGRCDTPRDGRRRCTAWGQDGRGAMTGVLELAE